MENSTTFFKDQVNLGDLIEYNKDSIVSRTLYQEKGGTITLFFFFLGQKVSEHSAPFDAMLYVLEGNLYFTIEKASHELTTGEFIGVSAGETHGLNAISPTKILLVMMKK